MEQVVENRREGALRGALRVVGNKLKHFYDHNDDQDKERNTTFKDLPSASVLWPTIKILAYFDNGKRKSLVLFLFELKSNWNFKNMFLKHAITCICSSTPKYANQFNPFRKCICYPSR